MKSNCHKCFSMKYGHHLRSDTLYTVDALEKKETQSKNFVLIRWSTLYSDSDEMCSFFSEQRFLSMRCLKKMHFP